MQTIDERAVEAAQEIRRSVATLRPAQAPRSGKRQSLRVVAAVGAVVALVVVAVAVYPIDDTRETRTFAPPPTIVVDDEPRLGGLAKDVAPNVLAWSEPGAVTEWWLSADGDPAVADSHVTWLCWNSSTSSGGCAERSTEAERARIIGKAGDVVLFREVPPGAVRWDLRLESGELIELDVATIGDLRMGYGAIPRGTADAALVARAADGTTVAEEPLVAKPVPNYIGLPVDEAIRPGETAWWGGTALELRPDNLGGDMTGYVVVAQEPPPGTRDLTTGQITVIAERTS